MKLRIGNGIDIHRLSSGEELLLGGVKIKSPIGIVAHSDGDILIHALVDSILGGLSLGDIGTYFPSDDLELKDVNSTTFLNFSLKKMEKMGYRILNTDLTIILQSPSVKKYNHEIRCNLSKILNIDLDQISLKATTTDKLGFIGSSKGICVISNILLISNEY